MSIQIIERDGKPEWAVIPYETYLQLIESGKRKGSTEVLTAIAKVLKLSLDDIVAM